MFQDKAAHPAMAGLPEVWERLSSRDFAKGIAVWERLSSRDSLVDYKKVAAESRSHRVLKLPQSIKTPTEY